MTGIKDARPVLWLVEWNDACSHNVTWSSFQEIADLCPSRAITVGYAVRETDEGLSLAQSIVSHDHDTEGKQDAFDGVMTIPKACITKRIKLQ